MFTDTHCHLNKEYYENIDKVLENAKKVFVNRFIFSGADTIGNSEVIEIINKYDEVYGTLGLHPHEALKYSLEDLKMIEENLLNPKILAIGEIGLDYYYGGENKEEQKKLFRLQLEIAEKNNLPVVIHSREATADTLEILKEYQVIGVVHSFSGSYEIALEYIKLGYFLGVNGVITFKNSNFKEVIDKLSLEYIILETDSPYLTPEPYRGLQNEPKNIIEIAKYIANLKGITLENLAKKTNENIARIFDI